jgi:hypothetical protein
MYDDATLLPSVTLIYERLTRNQRERHRLRTLLRLARHASDDRQGRSSPKRRDETVGRKGEQ